MQHPRADSWALTVAVSPRSRVRVAVVDAYGTVLNDYRDRTLGAAAPERPWAVYLAGPDRRFRLLAFDLDAHGDPAAAARDADVLGGLLRDVGVSYVLCESGPTGGRHVWVGLAESVDAETVATLARLIKHLCPTLDLSPLCNAVTGCVRPPGAPHRAGGRSTVLSGDVDALSAPTATAAQVRALVSLVAGLVDDTEPARPIDPRSPLPLDTHGRLHLAGPRRQLPANSSAALRETPLDASATLWRVLIGAAAARWRHSDVAALVDTEPGLEHVRSRVTTRGRAARPRGEQAAVLGRQWDKAVRYVAASDRQIGDDPTFDRRADAMATHVRDVQQRADVAAGRWTRGGGPADRRVLDVLSFLALHALSASVEADIRRLALLAGVGRETARMALLRLADDGRIAQTTAADGTRAAHWTIDPQGVLHSNSNLARSQTDPRPPGAGAAERTTLLATLRTRITDAAHDLFTATCPALGHLAGNLYARMDSRPRTLDELSPIIGADPLRTRRLLDRLTYAGIIERGREGWRRVDAHSPPRPLSAPESPADSRPAQAGTVSSARRRPGGRPRRRGCAHRVDPTGVVDRAVGNSLSFLTTAPTPTARTRADPTGDWTTSQLDASSSRSARERPCGHTSATPAEISAREPLSTPAPPTLTLRASGSTPAIAPTG